MNYSTWNKWDLHIHTRASKKTCGKSEYFGEEFEFKEEECIEFCDNIIATGVKLVTITDHNCFNANQFNKIKKLFNEKNCNALPGAELKVFYFLNKETKEVEYPLNNDHSSLVESKPLHCIIIFNDDNICSDKFYHDIENLFENIYASSDVAYIGDIVDIFLQNKYEFILIPHYEKHNDLDGVIKNKSGNSSLTTNMELKTQWIVGGFFSGLDGNISKIKLSKIKVINFLKDIYEFDLPAIKTSDNHNYKEYSGDVSEYKALPTFNGLKMCFSDYAQRIRYNEQCLSRGDMISEIVISTNDNDKITGGTITLSPYLNCIIGGRSSGKSLLLALIGKAVGERTNNHTNREQEDIYKKFLQRYKSFTDITSTTLLKADGNNYDGKIDIYLQDSIIKRFEDKESFLLADDFKEEFNETENYDIEANKNGIINDLKKLIDIMDKLNVLYKTFKSKGNILTSIRLPTIKNSFLVFTDKAKANFGKMKEKTTKLHLLHRDLLALKKNHEDIINITYDINNALENLINVVNSNRQNVMSETKEFEKYLKIVELINQELRKQQNQAQLHYNENRDVILRLVDDIIKYINLHNEIGKYIEKINKIQEAEKYSENTVGNYRFVVKYSSKITPDIILKVLNSYRIAHYEVASLDEFVETYIIEDKKWSHNRTSEAIKSKLEEEVNKYIKKEYQIYEKDELINEMSEGRKASVFIDILLNKEQNQYPLIIDQPEDNMDNRDITERLVKSLRKRKSKRQIILVTHNPNVLVNGDAENVIIANKNDRKQISYINSAIEYDDDYNMIKQICKILEGGSNAFLKREKKYGLDITDTKNYGGANDD